MPAGIENTVMTSPACSSVTCSTAIILGSTGMSIEFPSTIRNGTSDRTSSLDPSCRGERVGVSASVDMAIPPIT